MAKTARAGSPATHAHAHTHARGGFDTNTHGHARAHTVTRTNTHKHARTHTGTLGHTRTRERVNSPTYVPPWVGVATLRRTGPQRLASFRVNLHAQRVVAVRGLHGISVQRWAPPQHHRCGRKVGEECLPGHARWV